MTKNLISQKKRKKKKKPLLGFEFHANLESHFVHEKVSYALCRLTFEKLKAFLLSSITVSKLVFYKKSLCLKKEHNVASYRGHFFVYMGTRKLFNVQ